MKQFRKIFNFELKYYLKNKVFAGVTVFLVLLIAVVMFFPRIMEAFKSGDDSTESAADLPVMLIKPDLSENTELITKIFAPAFPDYDVRCTDEELDSVKKKILSGDAECAFVMNGMTSYTYYVNNLSMYDMNTEVADELLRDLYRVNVMVENGMTAEQAGSVMSVQIEKNTESLGVDQMQNYWYTYIMIFALYMVILLYGQMVATNVATEKSSRAMELLITSAKPISMMFGKVIASCFAGLIQLVADIRNCSLCA